MNTQRPRFKTRTHNDGFELAIAFPGVSKEALEINLEKNLLTISGERPELDGEFEARDSEAQRLELKVELHEDLDSEDISARHHDGVLTLSLHKREELAPRKIDILAN